MLYLEKDQLRTAQPQPLSAINWTERFAKLAKTAKDPRLKAFYQAGCVAADTPISQAPLVALDFETTGLNPHKNSIVSIGLLPLSSKRLRCAEAHHWVLKPLSGLNKESIVIHGITHSDLDQAPDLNALLEEFLFKLQGKLIVVHYSGIERPFLNAALQARLGEGIEFPVIDTFELEARMHRQKPLSWWDRFLGRKPVSIRLADSRQRYHLPRYKPHNALTDALATGELLQAQLAYHYAETTPVSELWS